MLKNKYIFQIKYTEAILSNSNRKLLFFKFYNVFLYYLPEKLAWRHIACATTSSTSTPVMVWNYQNADCSKSKFIVSFIIIFGTLCRLLLTYRCTGGEGLTRKRARQHRQLSACQSMSRQVNLSSSARSGSHAVPAALILVLLPRRTRTSI